MMTIRVNSFANVIIVSVLCFDISRFRAGNVINFINSFRKLVAYFSYDFR